MNTALPPRSRRPGRLQLLLLVAGCIAPMILATCMYRWQFWVPDSRTWHGELIGNGQGRRELGVAATETRWQLLVTDTGACAAECRQLVYLARQINVGLGREAARASHALATAGEPQDDSAWLGEYPHLQRYPLDLQRYRQIAPSAGPTWLWIVDPHGNLVLRYGAGIRGQDVLRDLKHLLKLSTIG
ncbi:hypothetical protein PS3A_29120 [Pseudomonas sp. 3A(2025)]